MGTLCYHDKLIHYPVNAVFSLPDGVLREMITNDQLIFRSVSLNFRDTLSLKM